jgi:hypothetical protein
MLDPPAHRPKKINSYKANLPNVRREIKSTKRKYTNRETYSTSQRIFPSFIPSVLPAVE